MKEHLKKQHFKNKNLSLVLDKDNSSYLIKIVLPDESFVYSTYQFTKKNNAELIFGKIKDCIKNDAYETPLTGGRVKMKLFSDLEQEIKDIQNKE